MAFNWQDIKTAPRVPGVLISAGVPSSMALFFWIPYPLTMRYLSGAWCAKLSDGVWRPISPQPTHFKYIEVIA